MARLEEAAMSDPIQPAKLGAYLPVSRCMLTDSTGVNHCKHPPLPRPPWHRRLRYRLVDRWWQLRERIGYAIARHQPEEDE
jgi:hypothetical protein